MTSLAQPRPVAELTGVNRDRFERDIRAAGKPVVLRGLASDWPAVRAARQSDEALFTYLKRFSHKQPATILSAPPEIRGKFFYGRNLRSMNFERGQATLEKVFEQLLANRVAEAPSALAVQSAIVSQLLPGFEVENSVGLLRPDIVPRVWIGNRVQVVPHYDWSENLGIVIGGRRRFTLFPPEQLPNLYVGPFQPTPAGTQVSMVDPDHPDLDRYPRYAEAMNAATFALLEPGDAIYIPYHWWHGVKSLDPVNLFINYWWNDARADAGNPYDALLFALFALKPLPPEQRAIWQKAFDYYVFETHGDPGGHLPAGAQGLLGPPTERRLARIRDAIKEIAARL